MKKLYIEIVVSCDVSNYDFEAPEFDINPTVELKEFSYSFDGEIYYFTRTDEDRQLPMDIVQMLMDPDVKKIAYNPKTTCYLIEKWLNFNSDLYGDGELDDKQWESPDDED